MEQGLFLLLKKLLHEQFRFSEGQNAVVIEDENLTDLGAINPAFAALPKYRQATEDDLVVYLAASFIGTLADPNNPASVNGVGGSISRQMGSNKTEIDEITNMTDHINGKISSMATQLAYVDLR